MKPNSYPVRSRMDVTQRFLRQCFWFAWTRGNFVVSAQKLPHIHVQLRCSATEKTRKRLWLNHVFKQLVWVPGESTSLQKFPCKNYNLSAYLDLTRVNPSRKALVKLRISSHKLRIVTYDKIPRCERFCISAIVTKLKMKLVSAR